MIFNCVIEVFYLKKNNLSLANLKKKGIIHHFFANPVSESVDSTQIIYLNSFHNLNANEEGYQMSENGPDSYFINYQEVKGQFKLKWKQRQGFNYLPNGRRNTKEMIAKRLENSI